MANWHPAVAAQSQQEKLLEVHQVASRLGLKNRRVRQLCENGLIRAIKTGRKWRIFQSALDNYVQVFKEAN